MDALIMCGGKGTRFDSPKEKPLVRIAGTPMIQRVIPAVRDSDCDTTYAVSSPDTPETTRTVNLPTINTPGEGYVSDLQTAIADERISLPVLTVAADLPLLTSTLINRVLVRQSGESVTVCVPAALKRRLGVSIDDVFMHEDRPVVPAGVNIVSDTESSIVVSFNARFAVNVNRMSDRAVAEDLL